MLRTAVVALAMAGVATTGHAASIRGSVSVSEVAQLMGRDTMYTEVVKALHSQAPAAAILQRMDEIKGVLHNRLAHVKEGCALDEEHFRSEFQKVAEKHTVLAKGIALKKACVKDKIKEETALGDKLTDTLKHLVPQDKFTSAKDRLSTIRKRAEVLVGAHESRAARYSKEAQMFKQQDKILTHVMSVIEDYYNKKTPTPAQPVTEVLKSKVATKSKAHEAVVTQLLELVQTPAPKKMLAGMIYEAINDLKSTFEEERSKRTQRYETRKHEHDAEIRLLTAEEHAINNEVKGYLMKNTETTKRAEELKKEMTKTTAAMVVCKKDLTLLHEKETASKATFETKQKALNRTVALCKEQDALIKKEIKLASHITMLIEKRVKSVQEALTKYEHDASEVGHTGMTGTSAGATGLEDEIKNSEACAKHGVEFWCATKANMKMCGVGEEECAKMIKSQSQVAGPTGMAMGDSSIGSTGSTGSTGATGATGAAAASAEFAKFSKLGFEKVLKVFDQNKDGKIGWEEIQAATGTTSQKVKKQFTAAAGADGKMDIHEFKKFMRASRGK